MISALRDQGQAGRCPRCGDRTLFQGGVRVADRCEGCGLDLASLRPGDRLLALAMMLTVTLLTAGALMVDGRLRFPLLVVLPALALLSIGGTLAVLRLAGGLGVAAAYARRRDRKHP